MARRVLFQIHWFLGITAGIVLAVMGVTGASMSFQDEIGDALSPRIVAPGVPAGADLSPDRLIARIEAAKPGYSVMRLDWEMARARSHVVSLAPVGRGERLRGHVDRATGAWLGETAGAGFFHTMERLHRWLALPGGGNGIGRQITGFSAIALIFFALSGLYLRWPRRALDWRAWLVLDWRRSGRNLWRVLHAVIGTWVLVFYLLSATTGMWWSYDWYRRGVSTMLTGKAGGEEGGRAREAAGTRAPRPAIDPAWRDFTAREGGRYAWVRIARPMPARPMKEIAFEALPPGARHLRQIDRFTYDPATSVREKRDLYADRATGKVVTQSMYELHRGAFFGLPGQIAMFVTSLTMPLFTVTGFLLYLSRRRRRRAAQGAAQGVAVPDAGGQGGLIVAFASQTGNAELIARNAAQALALGGRPARAVPLARLSPDDLAQAEEALFVVATYGDGEAPDNARGFVRRAMATSADLSHLRYGVLALGDREYPDFCAFGREVGAWLARSGATALFAPIERDGEDAGADARWHAALVEMGAAEATRGQRQIAFAPWRLVERTALNPGSAHATAFHLRFVPHDGAMGAWEAGDIMEIQPRNAPAEVEAAMAGQVEAGDLALDTAALRERLAGAILPDATRPLPAREYSAASIPADGTLDLVVRQVRGEDGRLGIGSGWLTAYLSLGETVMARVRPNPGFRVSVEENAPLLLIGNGTGIAGLRAHLRARARRGSGGHWLVFGERERAHDAFFAAETAGWLADGTLARETRCWSREADCGRYVQQMLIAAADAVRDMVDADATILVCGSLEGMASAVHDALGEIVGERMLERLLETGRYRRDVY